MTLNFDYFITNSIMSAWASACQSYNLSDTKSAASFTQIIDVDIFEIRRVLALHSSQHMALCGLF
jgi:hypothetical protein